MSLQAALKLNYFPYPGKAAMYRIIPEHDNDTPPQIGIVGDKAKDYHISLISFDKPWF